MDVIPADTTSLTSAMDVVRAGARAGAYAAPRAPAGSTIVGRRLRGRGVDFQDDLLARFPLIVALILGGHRHHARHRVPVGAGAAQGDHHEHPLGERHVRAHRAGVPVRLRLAGCFGLDGPTSAIFVVVPVLVFAVVFGLSMDYEVFLLSRIKEAFDRTGRNTEATMEGVSATASVITSAALIMILVFGVFAFARVLVMQFLGFGLAVAVLLDATVIRMVLVPAFMQAMGGGTGGRGSARRGRSSGAPGARLVG